MPTKGTDHEGVPLIVRFPAGIVQRIQDEVLSRPEGPYRDISNFLAVAAENQLTLENGNGLKKTSDTGRLDIQAASPRGALDADSPLARLLRRPEASEVPAFPTLESWFEGGGPLFVLTNRFSPMALGARVLANMARGGEPPSAVDFLDLAADCAREIGLRLRDRDRAEGIRGLQRRYVGWPVGEEQEKSLGRFKWSFLFTSDQADGPLSECGFATSEDGKVLLTPLGMSLAAAPSPLLGEAEGWTLGEEQQKVIRTALLSMPSELAEIRLLLKAVESASGLQAGVDGLLQKSHPEWSPNRVSAHRAAMVGRLREVGILGVEGWGPSGRINLLGAADDFIVASKGA